MSLGTVESLKYKGDVISPDGQAYGYNAVLDYESAMEGMLQPTDNELKDAFDRDCQSEWQKVTEQLQGTDYLYIFSSPYNPNFHRSDLDTLIYGALIQGYNPSTPVEDGSDFLWDEVLDFDREHPEIMQTINSYYWMAGENMPLDETYFNDGFIMPRGVLRQTLGTLFDLGQMYKAWGFGYPYFSDQHDTTGVA